MSSVKIEKSNLSLALSADGKDDSLIPNMNPTADGPCSSSSVAANDRTWLI